MHRFLTRFLLVLALFGVVTGSLLMPCDCGAGDCGAGGGGSSSTPACCRCGDAEASPTRSTKAPVDDGTLKLCHKPRAPFGEPKASVGLDAPTPAAFALDLRTADGATPGVQDRATSRAWVAAHRRSCDPWRISPEGLSLFLI